MYVVKLFNLYRKIGSSRDTYFTWIDNDSYEKKDFSMLHQIVSNFPFS